LSSVSSIAAPLPEEAVPLPFVKPENPTAAAFPMPLTTGSIPRTGRLAPAPVLKAGLDALSDNDAKRALKVRNSLPQRSLDRQTLTLAIAVSGLSGVSSTEIANARDTLKNWPDLDTLQIRFERALYRENRDADEILDIFRSEQPKTPEGRFLVARALQESGKSREAAAAIQALWTSDPLDAALERRILKTFDKELTTHHHKLRMDYLMYRNRITQAKRFSEIGDARSLYKAWVAL